MVAGESAVTGVDFTLERVNGAIRARSRSRAGRPVDVTVTAYNALSGEVGGDGPKVVAGGAGSFTVWAVHDGTYRVEAVAKGYVERDRAGGRGRARTRLTSASSRSPRWSPRSTRS